jgi:tRNA-2-methylthio-N6-dimethylallyladenosine synthase
MRRRYTRARYLDIVRKIREARPDVAITSDLIVGFPGESEEDFEETLALMREVRFSDVYAFTYSERQGTKAATFTGTVSPDERNERLVRLIALQKEISLEGNQDRIGSVEEVLIGGRSKTDPAKLTGRTGHNKVVNFHGAPELCGTLVPVRITTAYAKSLGGVPLA